MNDHRLDDERNMRGSTPRPTSYTQVNGYIPRLAYARRAAEEARAVEREKCERVLADWVDQIETMERIAVDSKNVCCELKAVLIEIRSVLGHRDTKLPDNPDGKNLRRLVNGTIRKVDNYINLPFGAKRPRPNAWRRKT